MSSRARSRSRSRTSRSANLKWLITKYSSGLPGKRSNYGYVSKIPDGNPLNITTTGYMPRSEKTLIAFGPDSRRANLTQLVNRRNYGYKGKGMYMGQGGYWGKLAGKAIGWLGEKVIPIPGLASMAEKVGDKLGDMVSWNPTKLVPDRFQHMIPGHMTGQGEYTQSNALVEGGTLGHDVPTFTGTTDGARVRISHREFVCNVFAPPGSENFQNTPFQINPGLERTFPWLAQIAQNYDEYTLHQCIFTFRSTVADFASSSGQIGQVVMATNYNSASEPFTEKRTMMEYDAAMSCKTSETMMHGIECDPTKLSGPVGRFIRTSPVLTGQDINQYDHAQFNIAVTETPATYANQCMGELWVSYTVELRKPRFYTSRGLGISRDVFAALTNQTGGAPFGTQASNAWLTGQQNNIGCVLLGNGGPALNGAAVAGTLAGDGLTVRRIDIPNQTLLAPGTVATAANGLQSYAFAVVIPAYYSGNLKVRVALGGAGLRAVANGAATGSYSVFTVGNVQPINDVFDGLDSPQACLNSLDFQGANIIAGSANSVTRNGTQEVHIRCEIASNGKDNMIVFIPNCDAAGVGLSCANALLDIEEYNTVYNYRQNGTNDRLVLVNSAGTVVPY